MRLSIGAIIFALGLILIAVIFAIRHLEAVQFCKDNNHIIKNEKSLD